MNSPLCWALLLAGLPAIWPANFSVFDSGNGSQRTLWRWTMPSFIEWRRQCDKFELDAAQTRIIGGSLAQVNMFPYQAALLLLRGANVYQCGGVLISPHFVLSAGHCLLGSMLGKVYLGSTRFADDNGAAAVYNTTWRDFYVHERYMFNRNTDDIGIVYLSRPAPISDDVQPIALAPQFIHRSLLAGEIVTLSGWGATADNALAANYDLYYVDAPVLSQQRCACFYLPGLVRAREHICTDGSTGLGTCDGDSGGPLTYYYKKRHYLVGLTAFGSAGGCEIKYPSVYTRITAYLGWIERHTGIRTF